MREILRTCDTACNGLTFSILWSISEPRYRSTCERSAQNIHTQSLSGGYSNASHDNDSDTLQRFGTWQASVDCQLTLRALTTPPQQFPPRIYYRSPSHAMPPKRATPCECDDVVSCCQEYRAQVIRRTVRYGHGPRITLKLVTGQPNIFRIDNADVKGGIGFEDSRVLMSVIIILPIRLTMTINHATLRLYLRYDVRTCQRDW